ncbi:hypothetical protein BDF20DRAFT_831218 [Mycotypha africana]|uniref:uncharacterized protein n=1 Tax=Mycotypha africana TaxID=64632 RepID=UPI002301C93C|nr:uncharacterized protein BDF20DRAFT_831218 [Mycotypha africana]KAI8991146.1 hypothetical protein BDF20DRAFT_831218 [Mycotypha africana]
MNKKTPTVYIILHSLYQHTYKLSLAIKEGLESKGIQVQTYIVPESLSTEALLCGVSAPTSLPDLPTLPSINKLAEPDGILFGFPSCFTVTVPAQIKAFREARSRRNLQALFIAHVHLLVYNLSTLFVLPFLAHHGMLYVPLDYSNGQLNEGSSSYGGKAGQPCRNELEVAKQRGARFGDVVASYIRGKEVYNSSDANIRKTNDFLKKNSSWGLSDYDFENDLNNDNNRNGAALNETVMAISLVHQPPASEQSTFNCASSHIAIAKANVDFTATNSYQNKKMLTTGKKCNNINQTKNNSGRGSSSIDKNECNKKWYIIKKSNNSCDNSVTSRRMSCQKWMCW